MNNNPFLRLYYHLFQVSLLLSIRTFVFYSLTLAICLFVPACVPLAQQGTTSAGGEEAYYRDKTMRTSDYVYEESIKTVLLYPQVAQGADPAAALLQPPVLPLVQSVPLVLEFDEMGNTFKNYRAKIFHCNADW